jgi:hypothetical protein
MLTAAASGGTLATYIQPPVRLLAGWPVHTISADEAAALLRGQAIAGAALTPGPWALVRANGELWATGTAREGKLYPDKVLGALSV